MNANLARFNMVQQQVRTWEVLDSQILDLLATIPRENFVLQPYYKLAFSDSFLPIGQNQVMLPPKIVGRLLQALQIKTTDSVLELGSGTGYITALLASLAKAVHSIEIFAELKEAASQCLKPFQFKNVHLLHGNAFSEINTFPEQHFDIIAFTGSVVSLDDIFLKRLKIGGRIFSFIGEWPVMSACIITRQQESKWSKTVLFETYIPPLITEHTEKRFEF